MTGPWVSGESLSPSRLNLHAGAATLATGFSTDTLQGQSGVTVNVISDLSAQRTVAAQREELGGAPSSTSALLALRAHSQQSDYLFFQDAAALKSNFLLGLRTGDSNASLVDGLNLYDTSHNTMLVRFSSDSVRFYPPIVAPVFDSGGALASTYNAALFLRGSSKESQIQAAVNAAAADGIARVYVPASLYPYSAASVSFDTRVQMVREGGEWNVFDVQAYGANNNGLVDAATAVQSALDAAEATGGGTVTGDGRFLLSRGVLLPNRVRLKGQTEGSTIGAVSGMVLAASNSFTSDFIVRNKNTNADQEFAWLEKVQVYGNKTSGASVGAGIYFLNGPFTDSNIRDVVVSDCSGHGIRVSNTTNLRTSAVLLDNVWVNSSNSHNILVDGNVGHIWFDHVAVDYPGPGAAGIKYIGTGAASPAAGTTFRDIHVEFSSNSCMGIWLVDAYQVNMDGVFFGGGNTSGCTLVYLSGTTVTNCIFKKLSGGLAAGPTVSLRTVFDDSINASRNTTGYLPFLSQGPIFTSTIGAASGNTVSLGTFGASMSTLSTTGAVLIGTPAGTNGLVVMGASGQIASIISGVGGGSQLQLKEGTSDFRIGIGSSGGPGFVGAISNNSFAIRTNNTARIYIDSAGSIDLGQNRLLSVRTAASLDSTTLATNEMAFQIVAGSVATLAIRSGGTIYYFASSASTKG